MLGAMPAIPLLDQLETCMSLSSWAPKLPASSRDASDANLWYPAEPGGLAQAVGAAAFHWEGSALALGQPPGGSSCRLR